MNALRSITVLGAGQIGFAIALLLRRSGSYAVRVADRDAVRLACLDALGFETVQVDDEAAMAEVIGGQYAAINALPFHRAVTVAALCVREGVHCFDLTEDVKSTHAIEAMAAGAERVLMPQCGLAPGFIGIVGNDLAQRFELLHDLRMRVGALPRFPSNALRYNLTWSTEGLINEYCNPCEAIVDGRLVEVAALDGLESFSLDGVEYEAFNTSGGLGTLTQSLLGRARNVDYKSVRYPGHRATMKLLLDDLRLRERRDLLKDIFENAIPTTEQDVIVVFVSASGRRGGRLVEESFSARLFGAEVDGHGLSAIQLTTASGVCAALDLVAEGALPQRGFIAQERVPLARFLANRFGCAYAEPVLSGAAS
jgi:saccharopine dehydrogenase-like NADP-dependent oxidoreductase